MGAKTNQQCNPYENPHPEANNNAARDQTIVLQAGFGLWLHCFYELHINQKRS